MAGASGSWQAAGAPDPWKKWWEESLTNNLFVKPLVDAMMLPGQVASGQINPMQPHLSVEGAEQAFNPTTLKWEDTGQPEIIESLWNPEVIERSTDFSSTIPLAGLATKVPANVLASGPMTEKFLADIADIFGEKGELWKKDMVQNVLNYPENWGNTLTDLGITHEGLLKENMPGHGFDALVEPDAIPLNYSKEEIDEIITGLPENTGIYPVDEKGMAYDPEEMAGPWLGEDDLGEFVEDPMKGFTLPEEFTQVPFYTGNSELDKLISKIGELGYDPEEYLGVLHFYNENKNFPGDLNIENAIEFAKNDLKAGTVPGLEKSGPPHPGKKKLEALAKSLFPDNPESYAHFMKGGVVQKEWAAWDPQDFLDSVDYEELFGKPPAGIAGTKGSLAEAQNSFDALKVYKGKEYAQKVWMEASLAHQDDWEKVKEYIDLEISDFAPPKKDPLAPKPLDTKKFPWMAAPYTLNNEAGILKPGSTEWNKIISAAYRLDIDISDDVRTLLQGYDRTAMKEATDRLMPFWEGLASEPPQSTVVPYALSTRDPNWLDKAREITFPEGKRAEAEALGFDPDQIFWKGTQYSESQFLDPASKPNAPMLYFSDKPEIGEHYGKYIYPTLLRMENPAIKDMAGEGYAEGWMKRFVQDSLAAGHDSAIAHNMRDAGGLQDQFMVKHPSQVRSIWAQFDPKKKASSKLLASQLFGFNPFEFLAGTEYD